MRVAGHSTLRRLFIGLVAVVAMASVRAQAAAACPDLDGKPAVFVKAKTPIRKGPGLNYQVSSFLERGVCLPFSEISMDRHWVLVVADEIFGWVPMGRLTSESKDRALGLAPMDSAVGSGQRRAEARVAEQTLLLEAPRGDAAPRRVLPKDLMVVPLAASADGQWAEVRDERGRSGWVLMKTLRGSALAALPIDEAAPVTARTATAAEARVVYVRPGRRGVGVALTAAVLGGAFVPRHSFDSDGLSGRRRYGVTAFAPSTGVELEVLDLGPTALRLAYTTTFLTGIEAEGDLRAGGNQHDLHIRAGWPVRLDAMTLVPELGYRFAMFDFDSILSDQPLNVTFLSTTSHVVTAGARLKWFLDRTLMVDADAGAALGGTSVGPRRLERGGTTVGLYGSVGGQLFLGDVMGVTARYIFEWRTASFEGGGQLDPTISEGRTSDLTHGLMLGLSFLLAG